MGGMNYKLQYTILLAMQAKANNTISVMIEKSCCGMMIIISLEPD